MNIINLNEQAFKFLSWKLILRKPQIQRKFSIKLFLFPMELISYILVASKILILFVDYHNQALYLNTLTSPTMRIYHQHFLSNSIHLLFLKFLIYHFLKPEKC